MDEKKSERFRATDLGSSFQLERAACKRVPVLISLTSCGKSGFVLVNREDVDLLEREDSRGGGWLEVEGRLREEEKSGK